jgi:phosphoadenylyl-sulfate reductase (thioredoxin)
VSDQAGRRRHAGRESRALISRDELNRSARDLETSSAADILRWATDRFAPRLTFATGFGMEGCVLIDLIARHDLAVDIFSLDTGLLFPETYELWSRLEARYGLSIRAVRPVHAVEEQERREGPALWTRDPDRCCALRKTEPLLSVLQDFDAWVSAIRRDQTADRAEAPVVGWDNRFGIVKISPLVRWSLRDVQAYVNEHDVPTNPLHGRGYPSIGCVPCTTPVEPGEDIRAGRWRGREKKECGLHLLWPAAK